VIQLKTRICSLQVHHDQQTCSMSGCGAAVDPGAGPPTGPGSGPPTGPGSGPPTVPGPGAAGKCL